MVLRGSSWSVQEEARKVLYSSVCFRLYLQVIVLKLYNLSSRYFVVNPKYAIGQSVIMFK